MLTVARHLVNKYNQLVYGQIMLSENYTNDDKQQLFFFYVKVNFTWVNS